LKWKRAAPTLNPCCSRSMTSSANDEVNLPPMVSFEDVAERQQLEDMRDFRKFLADSGVLRTLVKLYQHIAKNEMRMDNPRVVKEFLAAYQDPTPEAQEAVELARENERLRKYDAELTRQAEELTKELDQQTRLVPCRELWKALVNDEFWQAAKEDPPASKNEMTLGQIFRRICGHQKDKSTGLCLVDLLQPEPVKQASHLKIKQQSFNDWLAQRASEPVHCWCRDQLLLHLSETPNKSPFESALLQEIRESKLYPQHLHDIVNVVSLDRNLVAFLETLAEEAPSLP